MARTVSQVLLEDHNVSIRPGAKGECPFCKHTTFSVKADDSIGKCFHASCSRFLTVGRDNGQYRYSLNRVLESIFQNCHQELLRLASGQHNAYTYLRDERGIHPQVIADAMLGAVPSGYDIAPHFQPVLTEAQAALAALQSQKRGRPTKQLEQAETRLQDLQEAQQKLVHCLAHRAGWVVFFYTDAAHRCVALRLRQPYEKRFVSFKPGIAGVFGRELFAPFVSPAHQLANQDLLVVEGEFNALQLQTLTVRYEQQTGQSLGYVNACAVGSVSGADYTTLEKVARHPVLCYDNDVNGIGFALVEGVQKHMSIEAFTTPKADSDLDSYICTFASDAAAAWEAVKALIAVRQPYGRTYSGTGVEFFRPTARSKEFIPRWLGEAIIARNTYRYTASQLWVYRSGVYLPCGEATLRADAQTLLGDERKEHCLEETLKYVEVATLLDDEKPPDCQYINVRNGRLDWATDTLEEHSPEHFTTVQLPVEFDPTATCPVFDEYLKTTFDADVIPLIQEILGWCLLLDRRFEQAVMLTGEGENGKSVFLDLIGYLLGENNVSNVALQDLEENRFRTAELYGKLANVFADLDARGLQSSSMFKTLTTGDYVTAERKHGQPFRFRSYAKLLFSANKIPPSRDRTHAFYRRWTIIPFTRTFNGVSGNPVPNKTLRDDLKDELSGIFNQALDGLKRLALQDTFTQPKSVVEAKQVYIRSNDNVAVFVAECVTVKKEAILTKKDFYTVYEIWCDRYGERPVSQKLLKDALKKAVPMLDEVRPHAKAPWYWLGIEWSADADAYLSSALRDAQSQDGQAPSGSTQGGA
jgi:P4 family phage/plasmid primase-like protien